MRRILVVLVAVGLALPALATPKRLDLKKLLAQPQAKQEEFVPARAGWDGPEENAKAAAYFQQLGDPTSPQLMKATLMDLLIPDWRVALALLSLIVVLRAVRRTTPEQAQASQQEPPVPRAA